MGAAIRYNKVLKILIVISFIVIIIGSVDLYGLLSYNPPRVETEPHPLSPVSPASELPGEEIIPVNISDISIILNLFVSTYHFHNGEKGTWVTLDVIIKNNRTTIIDDLCFWKMTIYWADGSANFTTGFKPSDNYTIEPESTIAITLKGSHDWTGIPENLCWSGGQGYGRALISYDYNKTNILTTSLVTIWNAVE